MSLSQALNTSLSGLRTTQAGLSLVAANVANAQTPGYVRKSLLQETAAAGDNGGGVRVAAITRELDQYLQRQLRIETSGGAYADLRANFYQRLQQIYGEPGSDSALETLFNNFTNALQTLVTSPESISARSVVLNSAQVLAQHLNGMTADIQSLRGDAEAGLADAVATANNAMQKIATLNGQLVNSSAGNAAEASLMDQRDLYVDQLSELMDIKVVIGDHNQLNVFTNSGVQLVGANAARLDFNAQGTVTPATQWNADLSKSNVGTLTLVSPSGAKIDLIANKSIRSGKIAAYIDMRDNALVVAQNQLDGIAATMAKALSDETIEGMAVTSGAESGFELDTASLLAGDTLNLEYIDHQTNTRHRVTIVRVDDPGALPLKDAATADPNDEVIGVDFSGGLSSVVSVLNARFNGRLQFSNPSGTTLRVLDDGVPNRTDVEGFAMTRTAATIGGSGASLSFFTDGTTPYSGAITSDGLQSVGFAGRIAVNPALLGNPSKLVLIAGSTAAGDPARPNFIYQRLTETAYPFFSDSGLGTANAPFTGNLPSFLRQILSAQGQAAAAASGLSQGQTVVVNALKARMNDEAGVNVDREMANLITLQTAYGANARVMSAVRDMLDILMKI